MNNKTTTTENVLRVLSEDVLTLSQARKEIADVTGIWHDKATLTRWIHRGVGGLKLEAVRIGARNILTSKQALTRFIEARTQQMRRVLTAKEHAGC